MSTVLSNARIRQKPLKKPVPADLSPLEAYFQYFLPQTVLSSPVQLFLFPLHYWSLLSKKTKERMQVHLRSSQPYYCHPNPSEKNKGTKKFKMNISGAILTWWIFLFSSLPSSHYNFNRKRCKWRPVFILLTGNAPKDACQESVLTLIQGIRENFRHPL